MCVFSIFVILEKDKIELNSSFEISTKYEVNNTLNENCQYIHETPFAFCGESKINDCRNCLRESCSLIQCGQEEEDYVNHLDKFTTLYELCVPLSITDKKKKTLCKNFKGVNTYRQYNECIVENSEKYKSSRFDIYLCIILVIMIFSIIVIYYNVYIIKKKEMPFSPPFFLPELIFPTLYKKNNKMKNDEEKGFKRVSSTNSTNSYNNNIYNNI